MAKISIQEAHNYYFNFDKNKTKEENILDWLQGFRFFLLANNIAKFGDIMPSKKDISKFLNLSLGAVQNAFNYAEDLGLFTSKQCIGTIIKDINEKAPVKMVSKKDRAATELKKILYKRQYKVNEILPPITELAEDIKISTNTVRLAINFLIKEGVIRKECIKNKNMFFVNSKIKLSEKEKNQHSIIKNKALPKILKDNIKKYISQNFHTGEKIPNNAFFAKYFNVSIRTINIAMKELHKEKFILSRRGNYGSIFLNKSKIKEENEKSAFMTKDRKGLPSVSYTYKWEKAYTNIKRYILKNHEAGDKIPTMKEFSKMLNLSPSTVKRAVHELALLGVLYIRKGKYGGLFVTEMPQKEETYSWLAINPSYFEN